MQLLAQFAEDERLEQLTTEKRRLKVLDHRRQVQQLLEEKHKKRVEEWQELAALERLQAAEEKQRLVLCIVFVGTGELIFLKPRLP